MSYPKKTRKKRRSKIDENSEHAEVYYIDAASLIAAISLIKESRKKNSSKKLREKKFKKENLINIMCNHPTDLLGSMDALHIEDSSNVSLLQNYRQAVLTGHWAAAATILRFLSSMYITYLPFIYKGILMIFMYHKEADADLLDKFLENVIGLKHNAEKKRFLEKAIKWDRNNERIMFTDEGPSYFNLQEGPPSDDDEDILKLFS